MNDNESLSDFAAEIAALRKTLDERLTSTPAMTVYDLSSVYAKLIDLQSLYITELKGRLKESYGKTAD